MSIPDFLRFRPVPVRARRDGWTPKLQLFFIINIARGMGPAEAARSVGRSRQTAYALREKPGGEEFAAAWDDAADFAREVRAAPKPFAFMQSGAEAILVPRYYRGRLIGFIQREDTAGARQRLEALDRVVARIGAFDDPDAPDLETILDSIDPGGRAKTDETDANPPARPSFRQFRRPFDRPRPGS